MECLAGIALPTGVPAIRLKNKTDEAQKAETALSVVSYIYIYIYRKSASRFSRATVLNTLKQSRINVLRGKKDATTFPDKPFS